MNANRDNARVRVLLVSQMYPGNAEPDYGVFVRQLELALAERGHEIEHAVLTGRTGGRRKYARLARSTVTAARRFKPDVVYAHFLVPTGLIAALSSRAPLVVTAHGQDVANIGEKPGVRAATSLVARRASAVIAVSDYLRRELERKIPAARGKTQVVDCGVDLARFRPTTPPDGPPAYLCLGSLTDRKNVVRLAQAFERLGEGTLTFAGDGPLRGRLEDRNNVRLLGAVPYDRIPDLIADSHVVCQPSLVEPFGQSLLEGMACGRSVVATTVGGPPEFVPPEAGVLVDPLDDDALVDALRAAADLPTPNRAARAAAERHDVNEQARRVEAILLAALKVPQAEARPAA
ncbi:MAG TPA: glycosyltransferase [Gaiellaceae bacterium]|nr:glycosyltransferase [Gaiellaceae bacterium]